MLYEIVFRVSFIVVSIADINILLKFETVCILAESSSVSRAISCQTSTLNWICLLGFRAIMLSARPLQLFAGEAVAEFSRDVSEFENGNDAIVIRVEHFELFAIKLKFMRRETRRSATRL